jgi:hypothetical protein
MSISPTLLLDFDGVLHPDPVFLNMKTREISIDPRLGTLFQWAPVLEQILSESPPVDIVLSTSWAAHLGFEAAKKHLPTALASRVVDCVWQKDEWQIHRITPGRFHRMTRYQQIAQYVRRKKLSRWLAIDDDDLGWPEGLRHRLVATEDFRGLSDPAAQADLRAKLAILTAPFTGSTSDPLQEVSR